MATPPPDTPASPAVVALDSPVSPVTEAAGAAEDEPPPQIRRAREAFLGGRPAEAERLYATWLRANPQDDDQRTAYANVLVSSGKLNQAAREIEAVLGRQPESVDALLVRGNLRLARRRYPDAVRDFERVLGAAPDYCDAILGLSNVSFRQGDHRSALSVLDRATTPCLDYPAVTAQRRRVREAIAAAGAEATTTVLARSSGTRREPAPVEPPRRRGPDYDALVREARTLLQAGRVEDADRILNRILADVPDNTDALLLKGQIHLRREEVCQAYYSFRRIVDLAPEYCEAWYGLSNVYLRFEDREMARNVLFNHAKCSQQAEWVAQLGRVENADGNFALAREHFTRAWLMEPENREFQEALCSIRLFSNISTFTTEEFDRTGTQHELVNVLTYRPCRQIAWSVINERFYRFGRTADRAGLGFTWRPDDRLTLYLEGRQSLRDEVIPSRYEADAAYRISERTRTDLLLRYTRFQASDLHTDVVTPGIRQYLNDEFYLTLERPFARTDNGGVERTRSTVVRATWEKEQERIVTVGYATGGEAFSAERTADIALTGQYTTRSVFGVWREWIGRDWGVLLSASRSTRTNGNDSRALGAGVFFEF